MKKLKGKNYTRPGKPMNQKEFAQFIKQAGEGSFFPVDDLKEKVLCEWRKKYSN